MIRGSKRPVGTWWVKVQCQKVKKDKLKQGCNQDQYIPHRLMYHLGLLCYQSAGFMSTQGIRTHALHIRRMPLLPNGKAGHKNVSSLTVTVDS